MKTKNTKAVAFTGYRQSKLKKEAQNHPTFYEELLSETLYACYNLYFAQQYTEFYTGMCDGYDLIAAQAVLQLKELHPEIKLHAVLPYDGFGDTFKDKKEQEKYNEILSKADSITTISTEKNADSYLARNRYMVEHSDTLVCYHNPNRTDPRSGTLYTINYAKKAARKIINLFTVQD